MNVGTSDNPLLENSPLYYSKCYCHFQLNPLTAKQWKARGVLAIFIRRSCFINASDQIKIPKIPLACWSPVI